MAWFSSDWCVLWLKRWTKRPTRNATKRFLGFRRNGSLLQLWLNLRMNIQIAKARYNQDFKEMNTTLNSKKTSETTWKATRIFKLRCLVLGPTLPRARTGSDAIERHTCTCSCERTTTNKEKEVIESNRHNLYEVITVVTGILWIEQLWVDPRFCTSMKKPGDSSALWSIFISLHQRLSLPIFPLLPTEPAHMLVTVAK